MAFFNDAGAVLPVFISLQAGRRITDLLLDSALATHGGSIASEAAGMSHTAPVPLRSCCHSCDHKEHTVGIHPLYCFPFKEMWKIALGKI